MTPVNTTNGTMKLFQGSHKLGFIMPKYKKLKHYPLVKKNIKKSSKLKIKNIYSKLRKEILDDEKIVLRESMWDPVIRVYYNYNKLNRFSILEKIINEE